METEATVSEFQNMLSARGVSRRSFMKLCGAVAVAAGLSELAAPRVAQALEKSVIGATKGKLYPVIWIEGASCTGCTESFAQVETPDAASIVLDMISLNYSETLSAAAGWSMEEAKEQTIEAGNYILVYEGAVLEGWGGQALRVADKPGTEHLIEAAEKANAVVALGSCAVNGGWMGAHLRPDDPRQLRAPRPLRERRVRVQVRLRGRGQGILPVPAWLPRTSDEGELRRDHVEQPSQLVRAVRRSLHRMLRGQPERSRP